MHSKKFLFASLFFSFALVILSCGDNKNKEEKNNRSSALPPAQGIAGRVLVVADTNSWKHSLSGQTMDSLLSIDQQGLPNSEKVFELYSVPIERWTNLLQKRHLIIFPLILNEENPTNNKVKKMFSTAFLEKAKTDTTFFYYQKDRVCRNQTFMFLIAPDRQTFYNQLLKNKGSFQEKIYQLSIKHKQNVMKHNYDREKEFYKKYKIKMHIPPKYDIVKEENDFVWLRKNNYNKKGYDINLYIYSDEYRSQNQFSDSSVLAWREKIGQKFFTDPEDSTEYMTTQMYETVAPTHQTKRFGKYYSNNTRGLWRLKKGVIGGSFVSYVFYHPTKDKIYYVEGFINCPGQKKTKYIYEIEAMLHSMKIY
ncbi:MAG: DUF4837 family protein [Cytophagales bacterium]|nr:DUF4837 family protein [Cytophagales bacterium]